MYCSYECTQKRESKKLKFLLITCQMKREATLNQLHATMYIVICVFTYTCSQKHNNLSDSITM